MSVVVGAHTSRLLKNRCVIFSNPLHRGVVQGPRGVESQEEEITSKFPSYDVATCS